MSSAHWRTKHFQSFKIWMTSENRSHHWVVLLNVIIMVNLCVPLYLNNDRLYILLLIFINKYGLEAPVYIFCVYSLVIHEDLIYAVTPKPNFIKHAKVIQNSLNTEEFINRQK